MAFYYFDTFNGEELITDEIGLEFPDLEAVKVEAARGLADIARDVVPGHERLELYVAVRDHQSRPILKTIMVFEIVVLIEPAT
jgi:DNA-binding phage protein